MSGPRNQSYTSAKERLMSLHVCQHVLSTIWPYDVMVFVEQYPCHIMLLVESASRMLCTWFDLSHCSLWSTSVFIVWTVISSPALNPVVSQNLLSTAVHSWPVGSTESPYRHSGDNFSFGPCFFFFFVCVSDRKIGMASSLLLNKLSSFQEMTSI